MKSITTVDDTYWIDFKDSALGMPYEPTQEDLDLIEECKDFFSSVNIRRSINSTHVYFVPVTPDANRLMYAFINNTRGKFELRGLRCEALSA